MDPRDDAQLPGVVIRPTWARRSITFLCESRPHTCAYVHGRPMRNSSAGGGAVRVTGSAVSCKGNTVFPQGGCAYVCLHAPRAPVIWRPLCFTSSAVTRTRRKTLAPTTG